MRKCMMNAISMGCIAVGSFLMGGALGLALSKDESDIFEENCIKMEDLPHVWEYDTDKINEMMNFCHEKEAKDSYDRMTKELYGPDRDKIVDPYSHVLDVEASEKLLDAIVSEDEYDEAENESVETTVIKPVKIVEYADGTRAAMTEDGSRIKVVNEDVTLKHTSEGLEEVTEPYIISEDDYWGPNQYPEFAQENLVYYAKDDVLTTERDEVITDVEDIIGPDALTSFGSMCLDKDTVFVRNIRLGMEYEITRDEGSYQEVVLGYSDEEEEQAYKKAKQYFKNLEKEEEGATT